MGKGLLEALGLRKSKVASKDAPSPAPATTPPPPGGARPRAGAMSESVPGGDAAEKRFKAFADRVDAELAKSASELAGLDVAEMKAGFVAELKQLGAERKAADSLDKTAGAAKVAQLDSTSHDLTLRIQLAKKNAVSAKFDVDNGAVKPMAAVLAKLNALDAGWKAVFQARFDALKQRVQDVQGHYGKGEWDAVATGAAKLRNDWQDLQLAIEQAMTEYPKYAELKTKVEQMLERLKGNGMLDAAGLAEIAKLQASVAAADAIGPIRGYAAAQAHLNNVVGKAKTLRDSKAGFRDYAAEKAKVDQLIAALRSHAQAKNLVAELANIDTELTKADALAKRADGGALKALTALKSVTLQCQRAKTLADKLVEAEKKLPALSEKLEKGGVPKAKVAETARMAIKMLVEEKCSDDEAIKMAKDARGFADEGLAEPDAMMSSRVKKSLEDDGVPADQARSIGKNIRAGGSATGDDAKALGKSMKHVSKKAIDTLTADNIHSECCRGPVTDAIPELAGVKPRGWPETSSWDEVPGVYSGDKKKLVVGTFAKDGKRAVPKAGEGPIPHGASDLYGHEAGHAFDAANGGGKKDTPALLSARSADIAAGKAGGGMAGSAAGGVDDYFLSSAEGGANDAGAISETFAESFAMYFSKSSRWKEIEKFWKSNPWGI